MTDVSKFTTRPDIGTEEEPTINDDAEQEETIEEDEPEPTDEEDNDTDTSVPLKRPTGTDLELKNLTTAPIEGAGGKLIFASCKKHIPPPGYTGGGAKISCDVPGATPGDNVIVSKTTSDPNGCHFITSSEVLKHNVVSIIFYQYFEGVDGNEAWCGSRNVGLKGNVTFSIIVFRPEVPDIIGTLEELRE